MIITENQLDEWVRGHAREAQGVIVELVSRLVAASCPRPKERRFPLGDSIGQPGPDGVLHTDFGFDPFVPVGGSFWEIGTGDKAGNKATSDYKDLTRETPEDIRKQSTFIFVTPLSSRRDWQYTWKPKSQASWIGKRRETNEWRDVRVIDGSGLIDWLHCFPAVERWLACAMGLPAQQIETPEERWQELRSIGEPPPLIPDVFLANRVDACKKLEEVLSGNSVWLKIDTHFPGQMADFVSAYIATLDDARRAETLGRCLIVRSAAAWNELVAYRDRHIFIADFDLDDANTSGVRLLERAKKAGHSIIFEGSPGGIPDLNRVLIPSPKRHQLQAALEKAGYKEERARILAQKSDGNLNALLRCLQNLSLTPEWAQGTDAAELAIAALLGEWTEQSQADKVIAEKLSKKAYGEWIGKLREIVHRPATLLIQRDGAWKMVARHEGWYALGPKLFDEHLNRLREVAVTVLHERDPQFELDPDERYAANIHGKVLTHSHVLRRGLAESLALLGSHPRALTSCSFGKAEATAVLAVREVLTGADWVLWASLNDLLPLLAEAAPGEFLDAVDNALNSDPCPFDAVFGQEGSGFMGRNYMTGLLWALETLAWDEEYLTRVIVILGELAAKDPGGNWGNRPANSLSTILLPWLPQTCAPLSKRLTAVETLLKEVPDVAWKLLLALLPNSHQISHGSHKPVWREIIPDDWSRGVTHREYWEQVSAYAELVVAAAKQDISKLAELIERLTDLSTPAHDQVLAHLRSNAVVSMPQADRLRLWTELVNLVSKHRKFADAKWAMKPQAVNEIAAVADRLKPDEPIYRHQRLFSERNHDLYEKKGNYEQQLKELENRRQEAVSEVFTAGGLEAVIEFAKAVESPWRVGFAFGLIAPNDVDEKILPALLESETKSLAEFTGGFVWGTFRRRGWQWIDEIDTSKWSPSQKGQLLAYLPFAPDTWKRSAQLLGQDESPYWSKSNANPYQAENGLELAIDSLVKHGRPHAAIRCIERLRYDNRPLDSKQVIRALQAVLHSSEGPHAVDADAIVEIIKALQDDPHTDPDDLFQVEWAFLPLLDQHRGASPKLLERRLADDPAFFCEVVRTAFRSKKGERLVKEPTEHQKSMATNAYRLLSQWKMPPGTQKDGTFSGDALTAWLEKVKAACSESGHLEGALTMIGHVLIYAPHDPDGLWLHHSAATVLNAKDASDMRDGFRSELFNSRGVFSWTAGREERELAGKYREQAEKIEAHGYHRLASSLKELASSYERDAEQQAAKDPFDD